MQLLKFLATGLVGAHFVAADILLGTLRRTGQDDENGTFIGCVALDQTEKAK
jgi:hypothetical protein